MDDAALVQRAVDGDMAAFGAIYDRYAGRLHDFFWWVLRDAELAGDAVYETFLEAGARIGDLREPARLRPWLFAIAGLEAQRYRIPRGAEIRPIAPATGNAAWDGLVERMGDIIDNLSVRDRVLLDLRYRQGLDGVELADAIGAKPDDAAMLVGSLGQRVEREIGATAVAYFGRDRCPALDDLVGPVDGHLDAKTREKVANHADLCQTCAELRRRRIGPPALIALAPTPPLAADQRDRVLEDVELADHAGRSWPARRLGFPPPLVGSHGRRWRLIVAAVIILLLGAGVLLLNRSGRSTDVASVGTTVAPAVSSTTLRPTTSSSTSSSTSTSVPDPGGGAASGGGGAGGLATGAGGGGALGGGALGGGALGGGALGGGALGGGAGGGGSGGGGGGGGGDPSPAPDPEPDPDPGGGGGGGDPSPPDPEPPDETGPSLSGVSVSPSTVRSGSNCSGPSADTATVTVQASDPSGVVAVRVQVAGVASYSTDMDNVGGSTWSATVGPFNSSLPDGSFPAAVVVIATDGAGNSSSASGNLTQACET